MNDQKPSTFDAPINMFVSESKILKNKIDTALNSEEFSMAQIIEIYHQVINVTSIAKILKDKTELDKSIQSTIPETEKYINEKFNCTLHPQMTSYLKKLAEGLKDDLKNINRDHPNKTKTEIEKHAKMFEHLRQIMSTQEFVEQYEKIMTK